MATANIAAVVTGASRGIGYELSRLLARDGYNLILVARDAAKLDSVATELEAAYGIQIKVLAQDLAMATASDLLAARIQELNMPIHVLVNNAGFGSFGTFAGSNCTTNLDMILTNIVALTRLTQLLLPDLTANKGKILNVASLAGFQPVPGFAVYAATKAYVLSFSEALAEELKDTGVTVTALCPGITDTNFIPRAGMTKGAGLGKMMRPDTVAQVGYRGMLRGQTVVVPGFKEKVMAAAGNLAPRRLVTKVAGKMLKD